MLPDGRFKDIVAFLDDTPASDERARIAVMLARRFEAHLAGVHLVPLPQATPYLEAGLYERAISFYEEETSRQSAEIQTKFLAVAQRAGIVVEWRAAQGFPSDLAVIHARYADLAICGQESPDTRLVDRPVVSPAEVCLSSGRPVLVVPYVGRYETVGRRVLVAWKPTREAARAVNDAIPLMMGAEEVVVLCADPSVGMAGHGAVPGADIALHLARHGITARVETTSTTELTVGEAFLSRAADLGTDLIVMGAYGHSRLAELVLGGVTRDVLAHMTVPVLISH